MSQEFFSDVPVPLFALEGAAVGGILAYQASSFRRTKNVNRSNVFGRERAEALMGYANKTIDYVRQNRIGAIALIDSAARPFYMPLTAAWRQRFDSRSDPRPPIFFLNPQGFQAFEQRFTQFSPTALVAGMVKGDRDILPHMRLGKRAAVRHFSDQYHQFHALREEPVLVIDTCIHSGRTLQPLLTGLEAAGFQDVRVGVAHYDPGRRGRKHIPLPHLILDSNTPKGACYPFGRDRMIRKTYHTARSQPNTGKRVVTAMQLRRRLWAAIENLSSLD